MDRNEYKKQWYWENREQLSIRRKMRYQALEKIMCEVCKIQMVSSNYKRHLHTKYHALQVLKMWEIKKSEKPSQLPNLIRKPVRLAFD